MLILGINAFHPDSAACLLKDGKLVAAVEEERFRRIKHWAGLPTRAIDYCLKEARATLRDVEHVAINRNPAANVYRRFLFLLRHRPGYELVCARLRNVFAAQSIRVALARNCGGEIRGKVHHIEHHRAHLGSSYFASGFDEAVCVSVDGCGDFTSTAWGWGCEKLRIHQRIYFPHSLGIFYSALTQFLGFDSFGDEYKVMGLAAYGQPLFLKQMREVLQLQARGGFKLDLRFFKHHIEKVSYAWENCAPELGTLYAPELQALLGPPRQRDDVVTQKHKDIASSIQAIYEEAFFSLLNEAHRLYDCSNLALSGGCALNSVANGKIYSRTPFRTIYVPPAAGDAGGAIGAALAVWHEIDRAKFRRPSSEDAVQCTKIRGEDATAYATPVRDHGSPRTSFAPRIRDQDYAYPGPEFGDAVIVSLLKRRRLLPPGQAFNSAAPPLPSPARLATTGAFASSFGAALERPLVETCPEGFFNNGFTVTHCDIESLCTRTAMAIAAGKIVGWFQGRMEWGPRALGNRSILCDPRRPDMKRTLNAKIKRRESFRPFAPAILRAHVPEWFEQDGDVPFMSEVFRVRQEKRTLIPAVTHADGSGRLQTVNKNNNPLFYRLISSFYSLTSVPLLLNTSFNEQEPIVCHPEEALNCFLRTKMDVLVLSGFFITRDSQE